MNIKHGKKRNGKCEGKSEKCFNKEILFNRIVENPHSYDFYVIFFFMDFFLVLIVDCQNRIVSIMMGKYLIKFFFTFVEEYHY